jgi:zinc transporter ZupT
MARDDDDDDDDAASNEETEYNDYGERVSPPAPIMTAAAPGAAAAAASKKLVLDATLEEKSKDEDGLEAQKNAPSVATATTRRTPINYTLAASILVGDFFHNFTDGVFLGSAFSLCSRELGYTLVASTVYHELAQEIADFFLLTNTCHLYEWEALALNFVAGFSVMIGALMVLAIDMTDTSKGIVLALSAGVYLHIAASECIPRAQGQCKTSKDALVFLLCFILGVIPIGLVLLNHGHCEADAH